jgi:3-oxoacyl-[acyl-carrier protein] reductase
VAYSATKGAINSFTRALAKEVGPSGIQVNAIAPGIVDTEMNSHLSAEELSEICEDIPMGRMSKADEIADAAINILRMPKYLTGEIIRIDGGWI